MQAVDACSCGTQRPYQACCQRYHLKPGSALTPEALMRSRYSAFVLKNIKYLEKTQAQEAKKIFNRKKTTQWMNSVTWLGLTVIDAPRPQLGDVEATVTFQAHYQQQGQLRMMHDCSCFQLIEGVWYYVRSTNV